MNLQKNPGTKNIDFVYDNNLCHFCGACYGVCPKDNVSITISFNGNPIFKVANPEKCSTCDLCYQACPGHEVDFEKLHKEVFAKPYKFNFLGSYLSCFLAHSTDDEIRFNASSGGAVSSILITALERGAIDGALVVKMSENSNPLKTETYMAKSKEDILISRGSKYMTVPLDMGLREVWQTHKEERYCFVGLPCHIHGLRKAQCLIPKLKRRVVLTIAIFCGRGTSQLGTIYVLKKLRVKKEDVMKIEYRKRKWPGGFVVTLKTGEERFLLLDDYVYIMKIFQNARCSLCADHTGELADISTGDAWLPELSGQDGWNILMTRTKHGEDLIKDAIYSKNLEVIPTDASKVKFSQKLMLYDKKQIIFPMINIARFLRLDNAIPKYSGLKFPKELTFHEYLRALIFFVLPRMTARKSFNFLINLLLKIPIKFLRMEFRKKQAAVTKKVMEIK
ncbi:MAG: Coenzyme F420 hydrogenase/dehydrogenase, beta subunit C-terminal domain [Planctomycetota bacterium]|jgi:coenzyme F420 hydrogenase subunit beta